MVNNIHNPGIQMQLKYHARYTLAEVLLLAACISPPGKPATMQAGNHASLAGMRLAAKLR